jgi:hypothetical protein
VFANRTYLLLGFVWGNRKGEEEEEEMEFTP